MFSQAKREKNLGEFEQIVLLALLRLGKDAYGVSIRHEIEKRTGRKISFSAVYTTLDRLERQGLVSTLMGEPTHERGGRRKKHFFLEARGEAALSQAYRGFKAMVSGLEKRLENL
jgi:DNA-binding PadR family transcriptional regulator